MFNDQNFGERPMLPVNDDQNFGEPTTNVAG